MGKQTSREGAAVTKFLFSPATQHFVAPRAAMELAASRCGPRPRQVETRLRMIDGVPRAVPVFEMVHTAPQDDFNRRYVPRANRRKSGAG